MTLRAIAMAHTRSSETSKKVEERAHRCHKFYARIQSLVRERMMAYMNTRHWQAHQGSAGHNTHRSSFNMM